MIFVASRSVPHIACVHSPCSHRCVVRWGGHVRCSCVCCLWLECRASFSTASTDAIIDHSQSTKDFKSNLYVKDPSHRKPVTMLPNDRSKPGERTRVTQNFISAIGLIRTHNLLIDSPACYHWAINALYNDQNAPNHTFSFRQNSGDDTAKKAPFVLRPIT